MTTHRQRPERLARSPHDDHQMATRCNHWESGNRHRQTDAVAVPEIVVRMTDEILWKETR